MLAILRPKKIHQRCAAPKALFSCLDIHHLETYVARVSHLFSFNMADTISLAEYLFTRLRQLGITSIHGVPGDYNLNLLDYVVPCGMRWVGNVNELNAAYAADGYARIKGMGALITTFGVGELSAINAIAGAYAERAAIVHIVGTPDRATQDARLSVHHTFNDGDYRRFSKMHAHVVVAHASLRDLWACPAQIDDVLRECLLKSRPVYIEVPVDMVSALVPAAPLCEEITRPLPLPSSILSEALTNVLERIYAVKRPVILVDGESRALGIVEDVQTLIKTTNWPVWTTPYGKGLFDETQPNFHGIYKGKFDSATVRGLFEDADLIMCFGPHHSSSNTYEHSSIPKATTTIYFTETEISINGRILRDVPIRLAISELLLRIDRSKLPQHDLILKNDYSRSGEKNVFSEVSKHEPITHDKLWRALNSFLRSGDIVLGEAGTSGYGVREMRLPSRSRLFAPATWLSIGYMLPAAQGAALAQRELNQEEWHGDSPSESRRNDRTILFIGDGSFQMTAQELSTIIRHDLNVVVFVINNNGYTIERCIHGLREHYNDIARWRYLDAPGFLGASQDTFTATVKTWDELEETLANERLTDGRGLRMVELVLEQEDVPEGPLSVYLSNERRRIG
jgi:pyruvate decarboxylase